MKFGFIVAVFIFLVVIMSNAQNDGQSLTRGNAYGRASAHMSIDGSRIFIVGGRTSLWIVGTTSVYNYDFYYGFGNMENLYYPEDMLTSIKYDPSVTVFSRDFRYSAKHILKPSRAHQLSTTIGSPPRPPNYSNATYLNTEYLDKDFTIAITQQGKLVTSIPKISGKTVDVLKGLTLADATNGIAEKQLIPEAEIIYDRDTEGEGIFLTNNSGQKLVKVTRFVKPKVVNQTASVTIYDLETGKKINSTLPGEGTISMSDRYMMAIKPTHGQPLRDIVLTDIYSGKQYPLTFSDSVNFEGRTFLIEDVIYHFNQSRMRVTTYEVKAEKIIKTAEYDVSKMKSLISPGQNYTWFVAKGSLLVAVPQDQFFSDGDGAYMRVYDFKANKGAFTMNIFEKPLPPPLTLNSPNLSPADKARLEGECVQEKAKLDYPVGTTMSYRPSSKPTIPELILADYDCATHMYIVIRPASKPGDGIGIEMRSLGQISFSLTPCDCNYGICQACNGYGGSTKQNYVEGKRSGWEWYSFNVYVDHYIPAHFETTTAICSQCKGSGIAKK